MVLAEVCSSYCGGGISCKSSLAEKNARQSSKLPAKDVGNYFAEAEK
jgi:hypothetical protein